MQKLNINTITNLKWNLSTILVFVGVGLGILLTIISLIYLIVRLNKKKKIKKEEVDKKIEAKQENNVKIVGQTKRKEVTETKVTTYFYDDENDITIEKTESKPSVKLEQADKNKLQPNVSEKTFINEKEKTIDELKVESNLTKEVTNIKNESLKENNKEKKKAIYQTAIAKDKKAIEKLSESSVELIELVDNEEDINFHEVHAKDKDTL